MVILGSSLSSFDNIFTMAANVTMTGNATVADNDKRAMGADEALSVLILTFSCGVLVYWFFATFLDFLQK